MNNDRIHTKEIIPATISIERQVQFLLAIMILVGVILGNSFSQWFYMLAVAAGCDLLISSLNGKGPLAWLLSCLPWNKPL